MKTQRARAKDKEEEMALLSPAEHKQSIDKKRQNAAERSKRYRDNKKKRAQNDAMAERNTFVAKSYSSRATLGKAKKKAERALPESPTRKKAVLVSLFNDMDESERNELVNVISSKPSTITSNESTKFDNVAKNVRQFYERDDISRVSPKTKDVYEQIDSLTGLAVLVPKRHMILTVREAHALYVEEKNAANEGSRI